MKISFEIDEQRYREAICKGWEERFGEELNPEELKLVPSPMDVCAALSVIGDKDIINVEYKR